MRAEQREIYMQIHIDIYIQICMAMSVNKCQADLLAKGRAAPAAAAADATVNRLLEWKSIQKMQNNCIKMICIGFSIAQNS